MFVFEAGDGRGGRGDGVGKEQPPPKTSVSARFQRWMWCWEDKESDMTRRVLPLLATLEMVSGVTRRGRTLLVMSLCLQMLGS